MSTDQEGKKPINHGNYALDNHFPVGQNHNADTPRRQPRPYKEKHVNTIPGIPGKDYPVYHEVPYTSFVCDSVPFKPGMYANPETGCQAYHVCHDNRHGPQGASFLCTNGTIFNQETFNCDWWFNVDCNQAVSFYSLNSDPNSNPYYKKPAEVIQYKRENFPKLHKPKLASNLLLESQVSPTFSKSSWPEAPTFPNFMFFSSEEGHPEPANPIQKNVLAPVVSHSPGEVKARTKVVRTASFSAPKTVQDSVNQFSNDAGRPEIKSERTILPSGSKQSFEMEEKIEKSQEILRKFEDSSESINIKKKSTILPTPSPSGRRVLRRRKRPRPNGPISATVSESTRRKSAYKKEPKSEISDVDIPEGAILDFEWGQRTS